ncbi:dynactin p62 family-domain-containing protein, partial [Chytriomyces sp. MP71]
FECPVCVNTLTVVSTSDDTTFGSEKVPGIHYLSCGICRWNSLEIDLKFDRPTGLAMQMQKSEDDRKDVQEFANLRAHFEKTLRLNALANSASVSVGFRSSTSLGLPPSLLANIPSLASLSAFGGSKGSLASLDAGEHQHVAAAASAPYEPKFKVDGMEAARQEEAELERMKTLSIDDATTLAQRFHQIEDQPRFFAGVRPQRVLLRTKRAKRCRDCDTLVAKPEQKAQIPKFVILVPAIEHIPKITIAHPAPSMPLQTPAKCKVHLKFANPLANAVRVLLAASQETHYAGMSKVVSISAPSFVLGAFDETLEFEDDKKPAAATGGGWFGTGSVKVECEVGLVEKRHNWAVVGIEVLVEDVGVLERGGKLEVPLLVKIVQDAGSKTEGSEDGLSFWVVIGL